MTKITFKDLPDTSTPLNANNLNTLQDNVENAIDDAVTQVEGEIPTIDSSVSTSSTNPVENQAITNYVDEKTTQTILFDNSNGLYNDITLNDNVDNYTYLKIYGQESGNRSVYTEVHKGTSFVGKRFIIGGQLVVSDASSGFIRSAVFSINSSTTMITDSSNRQAQITLGTSPSISVTLANSVRIFRIVGYK